MSVRRRRCKRVPRRSIRAASGQFATDSGVGGFPSGRISLLLLRKRGWHLRGAIHRDRSYRTLLLRRVVVVYTCPWLFACVVVTVAVNGSRRSVIIDCGGDGSSSRRVGHCRTTVACRVAVRRRSPEASRRLLDSAMVAASFGGSPASGRWFGIAGRARGAVGQWRVRAARPCAGPLLIM